MGILDFDRAEFKRYKVFEGEEYRIYNDYEIKEEAIAKGKRLKKRKQISSYRIVEKDGYYGLYTR